MGLLLPRVEAVDCGDEAASWLSDFLGQPCRLIRQSPDFTRDGKKRLSGGTDLSILTFLFFFFTLDLTAKINMCNPGLHVLLNPPARGCDPTSPSAG